MLAIGGSRWTKGQYDRVYLNNWSAFAGIEVQPVRGSGNISSASFDGDPIANGRAGELLGKNQQGLLRRHHRHPARPRHHGADSVDIRTLDGTRYTANLLQMTFDGIRAAIAAL